MSAPTLQTVMDLIDGRTDELVALTQDLIRFPTVNPPGEAYRPCAEYIGERLKKRGFTVEYVRGEGSPGDSDQYPRTNVIARWTGSEPGPCVHFNSHIDVVEVGAGWTVDPFGGEMKDGIDAVVVATPDHTHAVASVMAMRMGKHCYCEKPLTRSIYEARIMREVAHEMGVATQMGNQGTAHSGLRKGVEIIRSGAIGPVREVHVWTNRPVWPQGLVGRPTDQPAVPSTLDWDLWLGPVAARPYHPAYLPFKWRGWFDFGTGAIGDMGCHTANLAFMALKLGHPTSAEAMVSTDTNAETYAGKSIIRYEFPARGDMPAVTYFWYDGGNRPPRYVGNGVKLPEKISDSGLLLVGDKGVLFSPNDYGAEFTLLPEQDFKGYEAPAPTLPRSPGHPIEWIQACKGGPVAMSNFDYAGPFTESILVGTLAVRAREKILWDGAAMRVTNNEALNRFVKPEYRAGWTL